MLVDILKDIGPGVVTGAADDDPAGITTYTQAGAQFGYTFAWFALLTFPLMYVVQEMCARIGLVTGKGLAAHIRARYPRVVIIAVTVLLVFANTLNIAADITAMAEALRIVVPQLPYVLVVTVLGGGTAYFLVHLPYRRYAKYLKYLTLSLFAYVLSALMLHVDWSHVMYSTVFPAIPASREGLFLLAALFGTTISPYLFFWQTAQEIEEHGTHFSGHTSLRRHQHDESQIHAMRADVGVGMFFSNLIAFFVIVAAAAAYSTLGMSSLSNLGDAVHVLYTFGALAPFLFVCGIVGTGLLAIPVLAASSAYAAAECFGWREGLAKTFTQARAFYAVIIGSVVLGCVASLLQFDAVTLLLYSAFVNALLTPIVLFFVIRLASDSTLMRGYASSRLSNILGIATLCIIAGVTGVTVWMML
jgi:NRAMP (natural resistance-associated macrophage protein)-like metal ion transporter